MTKHILHDALPTAQPVVYVVQDSDGLDMAYEWGKFAATELQPCNPDVFCCPFAQNSYLDGYAAGLAMVRILYGDPCLARWVLDGCPVGGFNWNQDFSDVVAAEDRDDYVGM